MLSIQKRFLLLMACCGFLLGGLLLVATLPRGAAAAPANSCGLSVNVVGGGAVSAQRSAVDPELQVAIGPGLSYVLLENSQLRVRYEPFIEEFNQFAIREFRIKSVDQDQVDGYYFDADSDRGPLKSATILYDGEDKKTVRLAWFKEGGVSGHIVHDVTIFPNGRFLKIDYVDVRDGLNIVDLGRPGGVKQGVHLAYGADDWVRGYITHREQWDELKGSYYNRFPGDNVNDPADGGSLNYNDHFILGVYNPANGVGFGRVMRVADNEIVKLLLESYERRGLEFFPYPFFQPHAPFPGYLYAVTGGPEDLIAYGQQLADAVDDEFAYQCGDVITLTAEADPGWAFDAWEGDLSGAANPQSLTLTTNHVVTARFVQAEFTLDVDLVPADGRGGTVTKQPDQPTYRLNDQVTLTADPQPGWTFAGWSGGLDGESPTRTLTMTRDEQITATFTQDQYTLTIAKTGSGDVEVTPQKATYVYGEEVTLRAVPDEGWRFSMWENGSAAAERLLRITGNTAVTANFSRRDNAPPVITPIPDQTAFVGQTLSLTVYAADPEGATPTISINNLPAGASFNDQGDGTAVFTWTPTAADLGVYTITFVAFDGGAAGSAQVTITVLNSRTVLYLPVIRRAP